MMSGGPGGGGGGGGGGGKHWPNKIVYRVCMEDRLATERLNLADWMMN